ncbi:hypothetical protein TrLO_g15601 [Triparma laevis f. longispina]|uniref:Protein kinase domain-containing protein n=1 Tax=Triparma laevis f. longispina TaxID=1714387 RepID=A0A9W7FDN1_9STRA|nr:hypothetical protein TrLO_g15601 [Triparma laevis f. longispina]
MSLPPDAIRRSFSSHQLAPPTHSTAMAINAQLNPKSNPIMFTNGGGGNESRGEDTWAKSPPSAFTNSRGVGDPDGSNNNPYNMGRDPNKSHLNPNQPNSNSPNPQPSFANPPPRATSLTNMLPPSSSTDPPSSLWLPLTSSPPTYGLAFSHDTDDDNNIPRSLSPPLGLFKNSKSLNKQPPKNVKLGFRESIQPTTKSVEIGSGVGNDEGSIQSGSTGLSGISLHFCKKSEDDGTLTPPTPLTTNTGYTFLPGQGVVKKSAGIEEEGFSKNKRRNERRAMHAKAVVEDLKESCVRLAVAEGGGDDGGRISEAISNHLTSLPLRYALSIDSPSEVLVHMRLMSSARRNSTHSAIHIQPLDPRGEKYTHLGGGVGWRLITISCSDCGGLLEYVTRVLSTGSSRVLDADVMLSSDKIALDRFVVDYGGRLRLDKLQEMIGNFLKGREEEEPNPHELRNAIPLTQILQSPDNSIPYHNQNQKNMTVNFSDILVIDTLAKGEITRIFKSVWRRREGDRVVACKSCVVGGRVGEKDLRDLKEEGTIAAPLKHENICRLLGVCSSPTSHVLVYEYCSNGSLHSLLTSNNPYEYLALALDVASGMAYLHSRGIIHRDLKSTNVLIDSKSRAKIADFGLSINCNNHGKELTAETGTYRWMAPEVIRHETYSSNADVYSFGIVLWQLVARDVPFGNLTPIQAAFAVAKEDRRPQIPPHVKPALAQLIKSAWHGDQSCRPSFLLLVQSLASLIRDSFDPANVTLNTVALAETALSNVVGNSTVNVDAGVSLVDDQLSHR